MALARAVGYAEFDLAVGNHAQVIEVLAHAGHDFAFLVQHDL